MLAKTTAKESETVSINDWISNLVSKWFGDAQKIVSVVFSLLISSSLPSYLMTS